MKLSDLINYKNELDKLSTELAQSTVNVELSKITHLTDSNILNDQLANINSLFDTFNTTLDQVKEDLKNQIVVAEKPWFAKSYDLYNGELNSTAETIFNMRISTKFNDISMFKARLLRYVSWHYAGLIIRPGKETFIDDMVGVDPLYVADIDHEFLEPITDKFSDVYQRRLRKYVVKEESENILQALPDNQFGVVFAYNYFNFRPFEIIKQYLTEIYAKLKPGGVLILTFNDCDRASAVILVEHYFCCYTPGYLLRDLAVSIGYEIEFSWNDEGPTTWLELRKPGELTSIKGGQSLAKILPK
jgi:SAM-dependent methyltransferase